MFKISGARMVALTKGLYEPKKPHHPAKYKTAVTKCTTAVATNCNEGSREGVKASQGRSR
jgi:hypothetical protein